jgi:nitrogen fixation protein NifZ
VVGCVYDVGTYLQDQLIYRVHFIDSGRTVGCREEELIPASAPWVQNRFEFRDKVRVRCALKLEGELIAQPGDVGEIENVLRDGEAGDDIHYNLYINSRSIVIPEVALEAAESQEQADEIEH